MSFESDIGLFVGNTAMAVVTDPKEARANPFDYLTLLQRHADRLAVCPRPWMPWNYRDAEAS